MLSQSKIMKILEKEWGSKKAEKFNYPLQHAFNHPPVFFSSESPDKIWAIETPYAVGTGDVSTYVYRPALLIRSSSENKARQVATIIWGVPERIWPADDTMTWRVVEARLEQNVLDAAEFLSQLPTRIR